MEINDERLSEQVLNWIFERDLEDLRPEELSIVDAEIGREEYITLREVQQKLISKPSGFVSPNKDRIKASLINSFDHKHSETNVIPLFSRKVEFWKVAAAAIVLLGVGVGSFEMIGKKNTLDPTQVAETDTVFIERQIPGEKIVLHDTVFIQSDQKVSPKINRPIIRSIQKQGEPRRYRQVDIDPGLIQSVSEIRNTPNSIKGNTLKDDSLWRKLTIVSL